MTVPARTRNVEIVDDDDGEDSRAICFQQGKPCIYEPEDSPGVIVTEWPNGTTDAYDVNRKIRTRRWPDGSEETTTNEEPLGYPHWPHREAPRPSQD